MPRQKKIDYASLFTLRSDGRYQGYYKDADGKRRSVCDRDPEALFRKLQERQEAADARETPSVPTFREVAEKWEREHREEIEERTWKNYLPHYKDILDRFGALPFTDVEPGDISADLQRAKRQGYGATVVRSRRSIWRMIYDYAVVAGVVKYNPVSSIKLPKGLHKGKRVGPTSEEMATICSHIDVPFGLFPFLLLCTGLRKSEALALQWSDIDFDAKEISVTKSIDYTNGAHPTYKEPKTEAGYHEQIDWFLLHEQCTGVHAATFTAAAFKIAREYLGIDFDLPVPWNDSIDAEPLLHDTLCGGVYGSNDYTRLHSSTVTLNAVKASRSGEKSSVLSSVFPKREYLQSRYPYLKKHSYLLPIAWAQRIAHYAGEKRSGADNSASGSVKLAKERIKLMKQYDIME